MQNYIFLGRERELALAELQAMYGDDYRTVNDDIIKSSFDIDVAQLGSVIKSSKLVMKCGDDWQTAFLQNAEQLINSPKTTVGFSVYGEKISSRALNGFGFNLKKELKSKGIKLRFVPNKKIKMNTAQVLRNQLTKDRNHEFNIIRDGNEVIVTRTEQIQDIDEYAYIDKNKPHIDPVNGMLPHKLAKTMINLSGKKTGLIHDPFCGSGTILMEAALKGHEYHGSDISKEMVKQSIENLSWLIHKKELSVEGGIELNDATSATFPINPVTVTETYLGPPYKQLPSGLELRKVMDDLNTLHVKFLKNLHRQTKPGAVAVVAIPAWRDKKIIRDLKIVDDLENIGYTTASFKGVDELVYFRPYQVVARRILVLVRK